MTTRILMYHSIGETVPRGFQRWVVRRARLRAQMRGLAKAGYATLTVRAGGRPRGAPEVPLHQHASGSANLRRWICRLHIARSAVLRDYGMTATLFVCPGLVGRAFNELPVLDWGAIAEARAAGFEIGGHSHIA